MKILLAADGTAQSEAAVEAIAAFKFTHGDEIKIISIVDMAIPPVVNMQPEFTPATTAEIEQIAIENAEKVLDLTSQKVREIISGQDIGVSTETLFGSPERRIVESAEAINADLIVGSHGYNRWERLLLGSVSDSVVHHAPCSVLVVRSPKTV